MGASDELTRLVMRLMDDRLNEAEQQRLTDLLQDDPEAVEQYVRLMVLHGELSWGAGQTDGDGSLRPAVGRSDADGVSADVTAKDRPRPDRRRTAAAAAAAAVFLVAVAGVFLMPLSRDRSVEENGPAAETVRVEPLQEERVPAAVARREPLRPLNLDQLHSAVTEATAAKEESEAVGGDGPDASGSVRPAEIRAEDSVTDEQVIALIDEQIATVLQDNDVLPSPPASDSQWLRRAWLTIAGRIPSLDDQAVLNGGRPLSRAAVVDALLNSPERHRRLAEEWTHLLIGRQERDGVHRAALTRWLEEGFQSNRSWMKIVADLIQAEGRSDRNGATNFLLAHLDNQATPATAVAARLFLGEHLQCQQCHDHPFVPGVRQHDYWAFNAFFQHTRRRLLSEPGDPSMAGRHIPVVLTDPAAAGMTFFETRSGRQEAVVPRFGSHTIPPDQAVARRRELARFLEEDPQRRVARAMVNRMWESFFGFGFTQPVDDMGPHQPVSHPRLLQALTEAFVKSGYDLRRLQKWIALSRAWSCSSTRMDGDSRDDPAAGTMPLFSRVYVRPMTPEQVYDSIRTAVRTLSAQDDVPADAAHRRLWIRQFTRPYETDENDEVSDFNGGVAQAMALMNGPDVNDAVHRTVQACVKADPQVRSREVLERIARAVLTREPTIEEQDLFRRHLRRARRGGSDRTSALIETAEDIMWAWLNSSEFLLVR